jgi:RimJ/RimL family protein N-acetyltransferase
VYLVGNVLFDADELVAEHVRRLLPRQVGSLTSDGRATVAAALGVVVAGRIAGGVMFFNWRREDGDIELAGAFVSPLWAQPATLRTIARYPFVQLNCVRVTALTARRNKRARRVLEKLGFRIEGVKRKGAAGRDDRCIYGLIRSQCSWLEE